MTSGMTRAGLLASLLSLLIASCSGAKLSPDQQAPPFARGSGGLILNTPLEGPPPANAQPIPAVSQTVDGVEREETETLKEVDGQLVRVVEGHFAYMSPEGIPVYVKYTADENGNRASFRIGSGASSGVSSGGRTSSRDGGGGGPSGSKSSTYLPPGNDRMYLPPS